MAPRTLLSAALLTALAACSPPEEKAAPAPWTLGVFLPEEPYEPGDAERGRHALVHEGYMSCGVPWKLWDNPVAGGLARDTLVGNSEVRPLPGRQGRNADLPHMVNAFTTTDGVEVVNVNCLQCHGGFFNGELVEGLGAATADFTGPADDAPTGEEFSAELLQAFGLDDAEVAQFQKVARRGAAVLPSTKMRTIGHNPAEMLAVLLMVHHDRDTLAWSDEPLSETLIVDADGAPIDDPLVTSDPPPWWRAHKKNALFYNGMARGDHRGTMMLATSVCVDTLEEARRVDRYFVDIQEYIRSLRAPKYPFEIDAPLAEAGASVFAAHCQGCHGTYSDEESEETYPNLLIPLDVIGTDPVVANAGVIHAPELVRWYNGSFYGQVTRFEPVDAASGVVGYMPPPLDGIWATAPFLHNGSVPTLAQVLDSASRPAAWRRIDYDSAHFDEDAVGWPHEVVAGRQDDAPEEERRHIYDTAHWSQSNAGHTFGDALTDVERRAVLEYLKTL